MHHTGFAGRPGQRAWTLVIAAVGLVAGLGCGSGTYVDVKLHMKGSFEGKSLDQDLTLTDAIPTGGHPAGVTYESNTAYEKNHWVPLYGTVANVTENSGRFEPIFSWGQDLHSTNKYDPDYVGVGYYHSKLESSDYRNRLDGEGVYEIKSMRFTGDAQHPVEFKGTLIDPATMPPSELNTPYGPVQYTGDVTVRTNCERGAAFGGSSGGPWMCGIAHLNVRPPYQATNPFTSLHGDCPDELAAGYRDAKTADWKGPGEPIVLDTGKKLACTGEGGDLSNVMCGDESSGVTSADGCSWHVYRIAIPGHDPLENSAKAWLWVGGVLEKPCGRAKKYCNLRL